MLFECVCESVKCQGNDWVIRLISGGRIWAETIKQGERRIQKLFSILSSISNSIGKKVLKKEKLCDNREYIYIYINAI